MTLSTSAAVAKGLKENGVEEVPAQPFSHAHQIGALTATASPPETLRHQRSGPTPAMESEVL